MMVVVLTNLCGCFVVLFVVFTKVVFNHFVLMIIYCVSCGVVVLAVVHYPLGIIKIP